MQCTPSIYYLGGNRLFQIPSNFLLGEIMKKYLILLLISILFYSCTTENELRTREKGAFFCEKETRKERSEFILKCIENANPKSDEEPEDWIKDCQKIAEETICEFKTIIITERCSSRTGCFWLEVNRRPKQS